jgi:hypothetical protein
METTTLTQNLTASFRSLSVDAVVAVAAERELALSVLL